MASVSPHANMYGSPADPPPSETKGDGHNITWHELVNRLADLEASRTNIAKELTALKRANDTCIADQRAQKSRQSMLSVFVFVVFLIAMVLPLTLMPGERTPDVPLANATPAILTVRAQAHSIDEFSFDENTGKCNPSEGLDTGIAVMAGAHIASASDERDSWSASSSPQINADGATSVSICGHKFPLGSLVGSVDGGLTFFLLGTRGHFRSPVAGRLRLFSWTSSSSSNSGVISVTIDVSYGVALALNGTLPPAAAGSSASSSSSAASPSPSGGPPQTPAPLTTPSPSAAGSSSPSPSPPPLMGGPAPAPAPSPALALAPAPSPQGSQQAVVTVGSTTAASSAAASAAAWFSSYRPYPASPPTATPVAAASFTVHAHSHRSLRSCAVAGVGLDTGIALPPSAILEIRVAPSQLWAAGSSVAERSNANGLTGSPLENNCGFTAPLGALVGSVDGGRSYFYVGTSFRQFFPRVGGSNATAALKLFYWDNGVNTNSGAVVANVTVTAVAFPRLFPYTRRRLFVDAFHHSTAATDGCGTAAAAAAGLDTGVWVPADSELLVSAAPQGSWASAAGAVSNASGLPGSSSLLTRCGLTAPRGSLVGSVDGGLSYFAVGGAQFTRVFTGALNASTGAATAAALRLYFWDSDAAGNYGSIQVSVGLDDVPPRPQYQMFQPKQQTVQPTQGSDATATGNAPTPSSGVAFSCNPLSVVGTVDAKAHSTNGCGGAGLATGLRVAAGDTLLFSMVDPAAKWYASSGTPMQSGADGVSGQGKTQCGMYANYGTLVGSLNGGRSYFAIGSFKKMIASQNGELELYYWDSDRDNNRGSLEVAVVSAPPSCNNSVCAPFAVDAKAHSTNGCGGGLSTGVMVSRGDQLALSVADPSAKWYASTGVTRLSGPRGYGNPTATRCGLSAKTGSLVGSLDGGRSYFLIGSSTVMTAPMSGELRLAYWDTNKDDNRGKMVVSLASSGGCSSKSPKMCGVVYVDAKEHSTAGCRGSGLSTGIRVVAGDVIAFRTADPNAKWYASPGTSLQSGADGVSRDGKNQCGMYANYGTLVGSLDGGRSYFTIGSSKQMTASQSGELKLYYWDTDRDNNRGRMPVSIASTRGCLITTQTCGTYTVDAKSHSTNGCTGAGMRTGLSVSSGEPLEFSLVRADAKWYASPGKSRQSGADGSGNLNPPRCGLSAKTGSLVGSLDGGRSYFLIGSSKSMSAPKSGHLSLYYWDSDKDNNRGSIEVRVKCSGGFGAGVSSRGQPSVVMIFIALLISTAVSGVLFSPPATESV